MFRYIHVIHQYSTLTRVQKNCYIISQNELDILQIIAHKLIYLRSAVEKTEDHKECIRLAEAGGDNAKSIYEGDGDKNFPST